MTVSPDSPPVHHYKRRKSTIKLIDREDTQKPQSSSYTPL